MYRRSPGLRLWVSAALLLVAALAATGARSAEDSPWRALADRVFRLVARNPDTPGALIPVAMAEDADGFLWLGGDGGLLRWDGYQFREHKPDPTLPDAVSNPDISTLHRDPRGVLWAGMSSAGLARYDPVQNRLVCVPLAGGRCGTQHVWAIEDDGAGGLWVATDAGLFRLNANGQVAGDWHHVAGQDNSLPDEGVLTVLRDHNGVVWVGTTAGLARFVDGTAGFSPYPLDGGAAGAVSHLLEDAAGRIWVGTRQEGAYVVASDRTRARAIAAAAPSGTVEVATEISTMLEIAPGRIWLGTLGRGIVEVDAATLHAQRFVHDPFVPNSLADDAVQALYRDRAGMVWVTTQDGLSQYNPRDSGVMTFFGNSGRRDGVSGESAMAVLAGPDGGLWTGFQGEGYAVIDPAGRRVTGLSGHRVFSLAPAPGGGVLLGTDGGLFLADPSGRHIVHLSIPQLSPTVNIYSLLTVDNTVWLGPRDGDLLQVRVDADRTVTVLRHETAPRLTNPAVNVIVSLRDGRLAVGTKIGLNLVDPRSRAIEHILPDPARADGLDAGMISSAVTDRRGRLWVGTTNGLDILEGRDAAGRPRFRRLHVADGLPHVSIDGLLMDARGQIWASTDMGLAVIDPDTFAVRALHRADGLAITNYWADSTTVTATGELVFGGLGGLTMVRPASVESWHYHPPVVVTRAQIGGHEVSVGKGAAHDIVVPPDANSLSIEFAALDFSAPDRNRYRYRLDGFDTEWVETDAGHRVASYTNLPPGSYSLRLRGSNRDGQWSEPDTLVGIRVIPAWYQTVVFRLLAVAALGLLLLAVLRASTAILRRQQRELERQVVDRTAELSASQIKLRHVNARLEVRVAERTRALAERTQALESSEARFRAWFDNAEDAVFVVQVEPDGRLVFEAVNAAVGRIFGVPVAAYPGHQPTDVWHAKAAANVLSRCREALAGKPIQFETRIVVNGEERSLDSWIAAVRDPATGQMTRLIGASRDMTERRALEARLAQAQKLQALGGLAGGIAHDFNNILQAVAGAALLIEQSLGDSQRIRLLARRTIAAAERGASITKRLLAFARSDDLRVEAMDTAEVLENLNEVLTYTLGSTISVRTVFAPDLPYVLADRGQLETALINLGTNARDAMEGGGVLTLSAVAEMVTENVPHPADLKPGLYVRVEVADTGSGMDAVTMARAVEPFFTTKPQGQGTGLGLALVKGFAEQSGGGMAIESTPGVGTTIRLWLRQVTVESSSGESGSGLPRMQEVERSRPASGHVLVVDDDDLVRETVAPLLEGAGFTVVTASGGVEALAIIRSSDRPDAMVCDLSMPGMNGLDTIRQARALVPGLQCFLLTGYAGEHAALGKDEGFKLLYKPISAASLITEIVGGLAAAG